MRSNSFAVRLTVSKTYVSVAAADTEGSDLNFEGEAVVLNVGLILSPTQLDRCLCLLFGARFVT
jgi:hypothetical protein